jgi:hypothetical protein
MKTLFRRAMTFGIFVALAACAPPWADYGRALLKTKAAADLGCAEGQLRIKDENIEKERDSGSTWTVEGCGKKKNCQDVGPAGVWRIQAAN